MTMEPQAVLAQRLSALLGFEDGADDVLEHLISIESRQDLTDYLSQLLGRNDEQVQVFVEDVGRYQREEPLSVPAGDVEGDSKPAAVERTYDAKPKPETKEETRTIFGHKVVASSKSEPMPAKRNAVAKAPTVDAVAASAKQSDASKVAALIPQALTPAASKPAHQETASKPAQEKNESFKEKLPPKSHPPKGKPSIVCGCYGSLHKPLTNCLYCGRISCEREGYDYCPFCGILVEQVKGNGEGSKAWEHKERLLRFDRDFARRTVVLDDQADFFTTNWLTEEERIAAEEKQAEHKEKLRTREKQKLDIAF